LARTCSDVQVGSSVALRLGAEAGRELPTFTGRRTLGATVEFDAGELERSPEAWGKLLTLADMGFGGLDVFCFGSDSRLQRVSCFSVFAAFARRKSSRPLFAQIEIVLPPCEGLGLPEEVVRDRVFKQAGALVPPGAAGASADDVLRRRVRLTFVTSLTSDALSAAIRNSPPRTVVLVTAAASYRDPGLLETGESEVWAAHIARIGTTLAPMLQPERTMLLLDTGRLVPTGNGLRALNESKAVSLCGIDVQGQRGGPTARLNATFDQSGIESTLAELETTTGLEQWERSLLKARYLARAERPREAFGACVSRIADIIPHVSPQTLIELADIARAAGQFPTASELVLRANPERVVDLEGLESCVRLAHVCGLAELRDLLRDRIQRLFPGTVSALRAEVDSLLEKRSFLEIDRILERHSALIAKDEAFRSVSLLASALSKSDPDYGALFRTIREAVAGFLPVAQAFSIRHATGSGALDQALLLSGEPLLSDGGAAASLDALSQHFLRGGDSAKEVIGPIVRPLERVVEYLAANPNQARVRSALGYVVSPRISGVMCVSTLTTMLRQRFTTSLVLAPPSEDPEPVTPDELLSFHERLMSSFPPGSVRFAGGDVLPPEMEEEDLPRILAGYTNLLALLATGEAAEEEDASLVFQNLLAALMVAKAVPDEEATADLIGLAGGALVRLGYFQGARDLAEHMLSMVDGRSTASARRHAWLCYADLYLRVNNPMEALIGLVCAAFADGRPTASLVRFWSDVTLFVRTLRDLGFGDYAREALVRVRVLLEEHGQFAGVRSRWSFLHCSMALEAIDEIGTAEREAVARDYATQVMALLDEADGDLVPAVGLATQLLPRLERLVPDEARSLKAAVDRAATSLNAGQRHLVEVFMGADLEVILPRFAANRTRYSADLEMDLQLLSVASRGALARAAEQDDLLTSMLSSECIAFHGATIPGGLDGTASLLVGSRGQASPGLAPLADVLVSSRNEAMAVVQSLGDSGVDVHMVGVDSEKRAIRTSVYVDQRKEIVREDSFSVAALREWSREYPRHYSDISPRDPFGDDVAASVRQLGLTMPLGENDVALVLDADLQILPANLVPSNGTYSGATAPITAVPSLSWLKSLEGRTWQGRRRVAWFGHPGEDDLSPLRVLREDIQSILQTNGFDIIDGAPGRIDGAEIIVIGAHGRIFDESIAGVSAFRAFADERSLRLSLQELCSHVEPASVVVLFACSAGRLDDMPFRQGLWGAPAAFLRRGCRTVVASPWPLDVAVPRKWLPTFLDRLARGEVVGRAAFAGNQVVHEREAHPARWLAMHVYGDPRTRVTTRLVQ